jgi:hypothetical protein
LLVLVAMGSRCDYPEYVRGHWAGVAREVQVAGHLAYVAGDGLRVIDASDPAQPVEIGHLDALGEMLKVALVGSRAYVLDRIGASAGPTALRIVDVSDPTDPGELGSLEFPGVGRDLEVIGDLAYVMVDVDYQQTPALPAGLRAIDVSDPAAPFEVGNFLNYWGASGGDVVLPFGFGVSAAQPALVIAILADPTQIVEVGNLPGFGAHDVAVSEGFAYGAAGWDGFALAIADVSNVIRPFDTGARAVPGTARDVELDTPFAYLALTNAFAVADVLDPLAPLEIGRIPVTGAVDVAVEGDLAFVAAGSGGLHVLGFDLEAPACSDGLDNDGDGRTDADDSNCEGPDHASEHPDCRDGFDNDGDGLVDHPEDPDCRSPDDLSEIPDCADGLDNDGDGLVDLADPSCADAEDPAEDPDCIDGLDNDGDGLVDHPEDPECVVPGDNTEHPTAAVSHGDLLVVTDAGLLRFDPATNDYGVVLDGRYLGDVVTSSSGEIFVSDLTAGQIVSIDAATGEETPVADVSPGSGRAAGMTMASDGSLWVADFVNLLRVEPATGDVTQISLPEIIPFFDVAEIAGALYVVSDSGGGPVDVFRVDPDTGGSEVFAAGVGPPDSIHVWGEGLALTAQGGDLLVAVGSEVYRLTPPDPTPVFIASTGSSTEFLDIAMAEDGTLHSLEGECYCGRGGCWCSGSDAFGSAAAWRAEVFEPAACSDGLDNDGDGLIDFDGGQSIWGDCTGEPGGCPPEVSDLGNDGIPNPDPQCAGRPWYDRESVSSPSCGLGVELALLLPALFWLRRRRGSG